MRNTLSILCALTLCSLAPGQEFRRAVTDSDLVVLGKVVGVRPLGQDLTLYRIAVEETLHGGENEVGMISVPILRGLSEQGQLPAAVRSIYCLKELSDTTNLPDRYAPYCAVALYGGSTVTLDTPAREQAYRDLVSALVRAEGMEPPPGTEDLLFRLVTSTDRSVRLEATEKLREGVGLAAALNPTQRSQVLALAISETDSQLKSSLASLCVECGIPGAIESLCPSLKDAPDETFAVTLGRLAQWRHGDQAAEMFEQRLVEVEDPKEQGMLLMALGGTNSQPALECLTKWREENGAGSYVDRALQAHGSRAAIQVLRRR